MPTLTARAIEALKPKSKPYRLRADAGLYLWVYPTGLKRWASRYVIKGKQKQYTYPKPYGLSNDSCMTLAQACGENERIQNLAKTGIDVEEYDEKLLKKEEEKKAEQEIKNKTFSELLKTWLSDGVARKDGNAELQRMFNKDVLPTLGKKRVSDITESDIRSVLRKIVKDRKTNRIAVRIYQDIVQLFKWAEERQPWRKLLSEGNPSKLVKIKQIIEPEYEDIYGRRERLLSDEEILELRDHFRESEKEFQQATATKKLSITRPLPQEFQLAVWTCLSTLCRIGELLMSEWKHINFKTGEWLVPKANVKSTRGGRQDLLVFLSPFALKQFKALYELTGHTQWCFPNTKVSAHINEKIPTQHIRDRQTMFRDLKDGKLAHRKTDNSLVLSNGQNGKWTPHDLRRTGATMMQKLKILQVIIDRCQNHVEESKVRRHYQLYDYADEKKEAWEKWGNYLEALLDNNLTNHDCAPAKKHDLIHLLAS